MPARYKIFRSSFESWQALFDQAAEFATSIGREKIISISHSADQNNGVVVVWYWEDPAAHPLNYGGGPPPVPVATFDDFGDGIRGPDVADLIDQGSDDEEDEEDKK